MRGDRRRNVRFKTTEGTVAVLSARGMPFMRSGSILDISEGGVAFCYAHRAAPPVSTLRLNLFGPPESHLVVPGLPCKIVLDRFAAVTGPTTQVGFCSIAFDDLSHREKVILQEFIQSLKIDPSSPTPSEQLPCSMEARFRVVDTGNEDPSYNRFGFLVQRPLMTESEIARDVLRTRPDVPIILLTGHSADMTDEMAGDLGFRKLAVKPVDGNELIRLVGSALDQHWCNKGWKSPS